MNKVHILPETLVRLIAAGEVIERPASAVKELVENSLDAGATSISIDVWGAGRTRLRVSDNGEGMSLEDAKAALERHATSKLQNLEDLESLATFGFRGEALPSIAAVSRLELSTRERAADQGWTLTLEGGKLLSEKAAGIPIGTTLDVQDLFFNTPARSKFMKRDSTERSHILKMLQEIALAHPTVRFELSMDGKTMLTLAPTSELGQRIADLWGLSVTEDLVALQVAQGPCSIRGFVNAVPAHHPTKAFQSLFVNDRPVQQRMLNHAIYEAYREWLPVGRHPVYCLFVELDPSFVDVNVHPTKREVRISDERAVYNLLHSAIRNLFKEPSPSFSTWEKAGTLERPGMRGPISFYESSSTLALQSPLLLQDSTQAAPLTPSGTLSPGRGIEVTSLRYLGQYQKLYLLFEEGENLLLIDQHAAAERVLYERLLAEVSSRTVARQALLTPLLWEVTPDQAETVHTFLPDLEKLGFLLEPFGASTFALKEWPVVLPESKHAKRFLEEILETFQNERPTSTLDIQHRIAASAACRAAVMASDTMAAQEVMALVEDLSACERPMTCPHGRPTHITFPKVELDRRFRRV